MQRKHSRKFEKLINVATKELIFDPIPIKILNQEELYQIFSHSNTKIDFYQNDEKKKRPLLQNKRSYYSFPYKFNLARHNGRYSLRELLFPSFRACYVQKVVVRGEKLEHDCVYRFQDKIQIAQVMPVMGLDKQQFCQSFLDFFLALALLY